MPIELLTFPGRRIAALILPDPVRRVLRFLFRYEDSFRAVAWMQIGADGSLYLNRRRKPAGRGDHAEGVVGGRGTAQLISVVLSTRPPGEVCPAL
jgi:hypothetical protein